MMLVKDLIYLLQTRASPEQEIYLTSFIKMPDGKVQQSITFFSGDFDVVYQEGDEDDKVCYIVIPEEHSREKKVSKKKSKKK